MRYQLSHCLLFYILLSPITLVFKETAFLASCLRYKKKEGYHILIFESIKLVLIKDTLRFPLGTTGHLLFGRLEFNWETTRQQTRLQQEQRHGWTWRRLLTLHIAIKPYICMATNQRPAGQRGEELFYIHPYFWVLLYFPSLLLTLSQLVWIFLLASN